MSLSEYVKECRAADETFAEAVNQASIIHTQRKNVALADFLGVRSDATAEDSAPVHGTSGPAWFTGNDPTGVGQ
jgi:hypothetical protein